MRLKTSVYFILMALCIVFFTKCREAETGNGYISYIDNLETIETTEATFFKGDAGIYSPLFLDITENGHVVVVEGSSWLVHLFDFEGNKLSEAGGVGSGPGEFRVINKVLATTDNKILVLDKKLSRLTVYGIEDAELVLENTKQLPDNSNYNMEDIYYVENDGYYGVYSKRGQTQEITLSRELYKLDDNLTMSEKLITFPEDEILNKDTPAEDWGFGFVTKWDFTNNTLVYSRSESLSWLSYNLTSGKNDSISVSDVPGYYKTDSEEEYMINRVRPIIQQSPEVREVIERRERLSLFLDIVVDSDNIYHTVVNFSGEPGYVLQIDRSSKTMKKIEIPSMFMLYDVHDNALFGIYPDESRVVKITMDDMSISMR
ncbi:MAG: hypothetical protein GVY20_01515 [Bacteroidetes bacterium]|jgi:hypothetical protein|nr:hypothetical protein [Bacteroidota bacterium]